MRQSWFNSAGLFSFRWSFPLFFLLIAAVNLSSLCEPPFWDDLIGVQTQAVFLARNHLNFRSLLEAPKGPATPCYYLLSCLSWFYALLYTLFPPKTVHLLGHLLNCAFLAGCGSLFLKLGYGKVRTALLYPAVLFALTHPILAARGAAMGQEAALALAVMLSLYFWSRNAKKAALLCALFSLTVKLTGIILPAAFCAALFFAFLQNRKENQKAFFWAFPSVIAAWLLFLIHFSDAKKLWLCSPNVC